jgi:hypothetical protein
MDQYEYGRLDFYDVAAEGIPRHIYFLHEESGWRLLSASLRLAVLNEVGSEGWIVYDKHAYSGADPMQKMSNNQRAAVREGHNAAFGDSAFAQRILTFDLRRVKPSAP